MKFYKSIIQALLISTATFTAISAELQVSIDHINSDQGVILAQIFTGEENYKTGKSIENTMIQAKTGNGELLFKNLTPGEYVVRMFHDENNNQKMDMNAFGMPTEGYGFSNEAIGNMGPPQYKDMIVIIKEEDSIVKTKSKMIYL
jgi:uncharacterized protein (DUF2141 family)